MNSSPFEPPRRARRARPGGAASLAFKAASMAACHSLRSISPSSFVSMTLRAFCKRDGTNKYCKLTCSTTGPLRKSWTLAPVMLHGVRQLVVVSACPTCPRRSCQKSSACRWWNSAVNWPSARRRRGPPLAVLGHGLQPLSSGAHRPPTPRGQVHRSPSVSISINGPSFLGLSSAARNSFPQLIRNLTPLVLLDARTISSRRRVVRRRPRRASQTPAARRQEGRRELSKAFRFEVHTRALLGDLGEAHLQGLLDGLRLRVMPVARPIIRWTPHLRRSLASIAAPLPSVSRAFMALSETRPGIKILQELVADRPCTLTCCARIWARSRLAPPASTASTLVPLKRRVDGGEAPTPSTHRGTPLSQIGIMRHAADKFVMVERHALVRIERVETPPWPPPGTPS